LSDSLIEEEILFDRLKDGTVIVDVDDDGPKFCGPTSGTATLPRFN